MGCRSSCSCIRIIRATCFRLYNSYTGNHLFTTNQFEIDLLTGSSCFQFINEGIAYTVGSGAEQNLYRFYHTLTDRHFYSANNTERDLLIADDTFGYLYEGIAFQVFIEPNANTFATPIYRFFDPSNNTHLYTASDYEKTYGNLILWVGSTRNCLVCLNQLLKLLRPTARIFIHLLVLDFLPLFLYLFCMHQIITFSKLISPSL